MKLTKTQIKVLAGFHDKQQAAKEHNLGFSGRILAEAMKMNYSTHYTHVARLVDKGLIRADKKGLTKKGLDALEENA